MLTSYEKVIAPGSDATDAQKQAVAAELGGIMGSYDSSADYWKLKSNGKIAYDGKANLYDENGNLIKTTNSQGLQGSLAELLNISSDKAKQMMYDSGMKDTGGGNSPWVTAGNNGVVLNAQASTLLLSPNNVTRLMANNSASNVQELSSIARQSQSKDLWGVVGQWAGSTWNGISGNLTGAWNASLSFFGFKPQTQAQQNSTPSSNTPATGYPAIDASKNMQDWDPNGTVSLGGSKYTLGGTRPYAAGCRVTADSRILSAAGVDITPIIIAQDKTIFGPSGNVDSAKLFAKYGLSLEGPIDNIEARLKTFVQDGSQGWPYATLDYDGVPNGHTINLANIQIGADGQVTFDPKGTSTNDWTRKFGFTDSDTPNYYKLKQLYIVTRPKK